VLARELAAAGGDHQVGFAAYETVMRPYVARNLSLGQKMTRQMLPRSRRQLWLRNQALRTLPYLPWKGLATSRLTRPLHQAANAIALKDHPTGTDSPRSRAVMAPHS
jgi:2-polyprenyl-6-methoxyphenol hydroxylase-like FAD-dependent oxidoreductase